jgi:hypothetical protein
VWRAEVVADSLNAVTGDRLVTFCLQYPRLPVHEHLLTHRMLSRNTRSNRAVSTGRLADQPVFVPDDWRLDDRRMRQEHPLPADLVRRARRLWVAAAVGAEGWARRLAELGVHRQTSNRLMEPFKFTVTVATATDWPWWFRLRCVGDAQGETQKLARLMLAAYAASTPEPKEPGSWHLPFVSAEDVERATGGDCAETYLCRLSAARCARVSTLTFEGRLDPEADLRLHDDLVKGQEWSPFEHAARAFAYDRDDGRAGYAANYRGWRSYRSTFANAYRPEALTDEEIQDLLGKTGDRARADAPLAGESGLPGAREALSGGLPGREP